MNEVIDILSKLGPQGLLAFACVVLWRAYEKEKAAKEAAEKGRLEDAKAVTPQMLAIAERVHDFFDKADERSSRQ